jgi:hypothetical protein
MTEQLNSIPEEKFQGSLETWENGELAITLKVISSEFCNFQDASFTNKVSIPLFHPFQRQQLQRYYQHIFSTKGKISDATHPSGIIKKQCTQSTRFNLGKTRWLYHTDMNVIL